MPALSEVKLSSQQAKHFKPVEEKAEKLLNQLAEWSPVIEYEDYYSIYNGIDTSLVSAAYATNFRFDPILILKPHAPQRTFLNWHLLSSISDPLPIRKKKNKTNTQYYEAILHIVRHGIGIALPEDARNNIAGNHTLMKAFDEYAESTVQALTGCGSDDEFLKELYSKIITPTIEPALLKSLKLIENSPDLQEYYRAKAAEKPFNELVEKIGVNRTPLTLYIKNQILKGTEVPIIHPGQIITATRKKYRINNAPDWRHFLELPYVNLETPCDVHVLNLLREKTLLPVIIALKNIMYGGWCPFEQPTRYQDMWKNFILILTQEFQGEDPTRNGERRNDINYVVDYLRAIQEGDREPRLHQTWNSFYRAAEDWHYQLGREQALRSSNGRLHKWNSLLGEFELDGYICTPLTDQITLHAEGVKMKHCVGGYWQRAYNDNYRIFHIENLENERDHGTLCITPAYNTPGAWQQNQLLASHNRPVTAELKVVGGKVQEMYQEKFNGTDERLRYWTQTLDVMENDRVIHHSGFPEEDIVQTELEKQARLEAEVAEQQEPVNA